MNKVTVNLSIGLRVEWHDVSGSHTHECDLVRPHGDEQLALVTEGDLPIHIWNKDLLKVTPIAEQA